MLIKTRICGLLCSTALLSVLSYGMPAKAAEYKIDPTHSFVEFKVLHLGFSVLSGRFNSIDGTFNFDPAKAKNAKITAKVDINSLDTNHAERDKHLRGSEFFNVVKFSTATFESTKYVPSKDGKTGKLSGNFTLLGVTKPITLDINKIGEGKDPWGGYRSGWSGKVSFDRRDFGMNYNLGEHSNKVDLEVFIEGIKA